MYFQRNLPWNPHDKLQRTSTPQYHRRIDNKEFHVHLTCLNDVCHVIAYYWFRINQVLWSLCSPCPPKWHRHFRHHTIPGPTEPGGQGGICPTTPDYGRSCSISIYWLPDAPSPRFLDLLTALYSLAWWRHLPHNSRLWPKLFYQYLPTVRCPLPKVFSPSDGSVFTGVVASDSHVQANWFVHGRLRHHFWILYYIVGRSWWRRRGLAAGSLYSSSVLLAVINGCLFCRRWRFGFYFIHQRDVRCTVVGLWLGLRTVDGYVCWIWESEILHLMLLFFRPTVIRRVIENLREKSFKRWTDFPPHILHNFQLIATMYLWERYMNCLK